MLGPIYGLLNLFINAVKYREKGSPFSFACDQIKTKVCFRKEKVAKRLSPIIFRESSSPSPKCKAHEVVLPMMLSMWCARPMKSSKLALHSGKVIMFRHFLLTCLQVARFVGMFHRKTIQTCKLELVQALVHIQKHGRMAHSKRGVQTSAS